MKLITLGAMPDPNPTQIEDVRLVIVETESGIPVAICEQKGVGLMSGVSVLEASDSEFNRVLERLKITTVQSVQMGR